MADETKDEVSSLSTHVNQTRRKYTSSSGEARKHYWGYINEPISSYNESFVKVLEGKRIADLINARKNPVVIDLMAPPRTVHDLLSSFPTGRGLAVALPDHEISDFRDDIISMYKSKNVTWLPQDITKPKTWDEIEKWLAGEKAHLIMERAMGGLTQLPTSKRFYGILLNQAWKNLDPNGGVLLFETPRTDYMLKAGVDLNAWVSSVSKVADIKYDPGDPLNISPRLLGAKIMITRTPSSPAVLPSV